MNINNLTIGQAKELASLFDSTPKAQSDTLYARYVDKYVICRSRNEGINFGKVVAADDTGLILEDSRRLYYHKPSDKSLSWYEGVAISGISTDSIVGAKCEKMICEDYSLTLCTEDAVKSITSAKTNEQD